MINNKGRLSNITPTNNKDKILIILFKNTSIPYLSISKSGSLLSEEQRYNAHL